MTGTPNHPSARDPSMGRPRNGRVTFYHATSKGHGMAVRLELRMNRKGEDGYNCFFLEMARQKSTASQQEEGRVHATFDWEHKATVKLDFADVCELLTVLEGVREQAGSGARGIYHEAAGVNTVITFKANAERDGYLLALSRRDKAGQELFRGHTVLSVAETTGLRCLLQTGLFFMTLGASLAP